MTRTKVVVPIFVIVLFLILLLSVGTRLYTDLLFFRSVGFSKVFTTVFWTRLTLFVLFGAVMAVAVGTNIVLAYRLRPPIRPLSPEQHNLERYRVAIEPFMLFVLLGVCTLFGVVAGLSASTRWRTWLAWRNAQPFHQTDPQFGRDVSYYVFTYPFERFLLGFLLTAVILSLVVALVTHYLFGGIRIQTPGERVTPAAKAHVSVLLGLLALLKAWAYYLDRFGLVFSERGSGTGAAYTDVNAVLPAKLILLFISLLCAVLLIYNIFQRGWTLPVLSGAILVLSALVIGGIYPAIVQQFQVRPNEASREAPYIERTINATREAYGVAGVEPVPYEASTAATGPEAADDTGTLGNVRLLDPNVVSPAFQQLQQIRGYYGFESTLDIDRYTITEGDEETTQDYVVAVREVDLERLGESQRNWINEHLTYTHGKGFVAAPANSVDGQGRPIFAEGDLPPDGVLDIDESRIYFGEKSPDYSIVGTRQQEIDGPAGDDPESQTTTTYEGDGGVSIGSNFRQLLFALRFGEKNIVLSSDITDESRILYVRDPRDRVAKVAPWLTLDGDPYPAVIDGRVTWILDGYTTTDGYPYSERRTLADVTSDSVTVDSSNRVRQAADQINYIRNSVKATVDAYDGTVTLYAWDESDPVLQTWMRAFPGTVQPESDIPPSLREHVRYPEDLFKVQRDVLASYHVQDSRQFYSQEDFWAVPPSPDDADELQPPFYVYSQLPGSSGPSFNLTSPLIARGSTKLAAYVGVSSDPETYGQFTVLGLPQGVTINGPVQARGVIESDSDVAEQLTLWGRNEQALVRGNLLTLPVADGLLYVQPYYVAAGTQRYPTLQGVAVAFGEKVGFGYTFDAALTEVFGADVGGVVGEDTGPDVGSEPTPNPSSTPSPGGSGEPSEPSVEPTVPGGSADPEVAAAIESATTAFEDGEAALRRDPPDFAAYDEAQRRLSEALARLGELTTPAASSSSGPAPSATSPP